MKGFLSFEALQKGVEGKLQNSSRYLLISHYILIALSIYYLRFHIFTFFFPFFFYRRGENHIEMNRIEKKSSFIFKD